VTAASPSPRQGGQSGEDAGARLLRRTRWQIALVTLALVAALLVAVGVATALAALDMLDSSIDRALETTGRAAVQALAGEVPSAGGDEGGDSGELDHAPAAADTYVLVLDAQGNVVSNPSRVAITRGADDRSAVERARGSGRDLRTVSSHGVRVRLLTLPVLGAVATEDAAAATAAPAGKAPTGFVQAGFVLTLHDDQARSLVLTILAVSLFALAGAAVVTVIVTRRALVPIGQAFAHERRFVAGASHELRTPVALIRASAEVLEREGLVADAGTALVSDIQAEADRLGRLVSDLLVLSTSAAGGMRLEVARVDMAALARDVVGRAAPWAGTRGIHLAGGSSDDRPLSPPRPVVLGDPDRLVQLLLVLVENAVLHSPPGGLVRISVATSAGREDPRSPSPLVEIAVEDQGEGVPASDRERIFEPFARLRGPDGRDRREGSGLGLAVARDIATRHRGTIRVDDAPGGGARFTVSLPLA
jgi:signal transduction histidine kinase